MYISDKQRVELSLIPQMIAATMIAGTEDHEQQTDEFKAFYTDLIDAAKISLQGIDNKKRVSLSRRIGRLQHHIHEEVIGNDFNNLPKLALVQFHMIKLILDDGYLIYEDDSAFGRSIITFMNSLQEHAEIEKFNLSSIKQAKKLLKNLQSEGYFKSVNVEE